MGKNLRNRCFQGNRTCTERGACAGSQSRRQSGILGHRVPVAGEHVRTVLLGAYNLVAHTDSVKE